PPRLGIASVIRHPPNGGIRRPCEGREAVPFRDQLWAQMNADIWAQGSMARGVLRLDLEPRGGCLRQGDPGFTPRLRDTTGPGRAFSAASQRTLTVTSASLGRAGSVPGTFEGASGNGSPPDPGGTEAEVDRTREAQTEQVGQEVFHLQVLDEQPHA